jgi:hypothetical protein
MKSHDEGSYEPGIQWMVAYAAIPIGRKSALIKESYNIFRPLYYISVHKEQEKFHKLHNNVCIINDLIFPCICFNLDSIIDFCVFPTLYESNKQFDNFFVFSQSLILHMQPYHIILFLLLKWFLKNPTIQRGLCVSSATFLMSPLLRCFQMDIYFWTTILKIT